MKDPLKLSLADYLPYLVNQGRQHHRRSIRRRNAGAARALGRDLARARGARRQWPAAPNRSCRSDQHRRLDTVAHRHAARAPRLGDTNAFGHQQPRSRRGAVGEGQYPCRSPYSACPRHRGRRQCGHFSGGVGGGEALSAAHVRQHDGSRGRAEHATTTRRRLIRCSALPCAMRARSAGVTVPDHDLQLGISVEHPAENHADEMNPGPR